MEEGVYWFTPSFNLFSYMPRDTNIYTGPGLRTSMTNTGNIPQACSQASLMEASFQLSPSSYETLAYVRFRKTLVIPITETKMTSIKHFVDLTTFYVCYYLVLLFNNVIFHELQV